MQREERDEYYAIETAIKTGDLAYARELLRDALRSKPTAHVWYLSALVAHDSQQRELRLHKALSYDPQHEAARAALTSLEQSPASTQPSEADSMVRRIRNWLR